MATSRLLMAASLLAVAVCIICHASPSSADLSTPEKPMWHYSAHEMNPLSLNLASRARRSLREAASALSHLAMSALHHLRGVLPRKMVEKQTPQDSNPNRRNLQASCPQAPANFTEEMVMGLPIKKILDATPLMSRLEYVGERCRSVEGDFINATATKNLCVNGKLMGLWRHDPMQVYGAWSADIKCPSQGNSSGLVTTFYTTSNFTVGTQDEIDFEFLNRYNNVLQINTWANGQSVFFRNIFLDFDCSQAFHNYAVLWTKEVLIFYVDYRVVAWFPNTQAIGGPAFPNKPSYIVGSFWDGSDFNANADKWCGPRDPSTLNTEMIATYSNIKVTVPIESAMCWWDYIWPPQVATVPVA